MAPYCSTYLDLELVVHGRFKVKHVYFCVFGGISGRDLVGVVREVKVFFGVLEDVDPVSEESWLFEEVNPSERDQHRGRRGRS